MKQDIFTLIDHAIVRAAVKSLPGLLGAVVEMRFWRKLSAREIALEIGVSERAVEIALERASLFIREECLRHPAFSRTKYHTLLAIYAQTA